jgi:hypothetical protein
LNENPRESKGRNDITLEPSMKDVEMAEEASWHEHPLGIAQQNE